MGTPRTGPDGSGDEEPGAVAIAAPTSMICAFGLAKELLVYGTDEIIVF